MDCDEKIADTATCDTVGQELLIITTEASGTGTPCELPSTLCVAGDGSIPDTDGDDGNDEGGGTCLVHASRARALGDASPVHRPDQPLPTPVTDFNHLLTQLSADPHTNMTSLHTLCLERRAYLEHLASTNIEAAVLEAASLDPWRELLSPWLPMDCMETMYDGEAMVTTLRVKPTRDSMDSPPAHRGLCGPYQQQSIQIDAGTLELATSGPGWVGACDGESTIPPV